MDTLTGGTAGDSLIGGTGADGFTAGTGNDTISARNEDVDTSFSCGENAGDTDTVNADLDPERPGHGRRRQLRGRRQGLRDPGPPAAAGPVAPVRAFASAASA